MLYLNEIVLALSVQTHNIQFNGTVHLPAAKERLKTYWPYWNN